MNSRNFPHLDETNAPLGSREPLTRAKLAFGGIPRPLARYASSPVTLQTALAGLHAFESSTLVPLEREVLAMTMGKRNGCKFCVDFHERLLTTQRAPSPLVQALVSGEPLPTARLEALRQFIIALLDCHGDVPPSVWSNFREAGYRHEQALEVVMGVSVYTLTTLANRLTESSE